MGRISIADSLETFEVDLWGRIFESVPVTRSVQMRATELERGEGEALESEEPDEIVAYLGKILDLRLKPAKGARKAASEVIAEKWQADELSIPTLLAFVQRLGEADDPPA